MTSPTQPRRRISNVRFVPRAELKRGKATVGAPMLALATMTAVALAITVLAVTISAAQAMQ